MKKSRFTDEQIVTMVQESEASSVAEVARKHQVTEQTESPRVWSRVPGLSHTEMVDPMFAK